MQKIYDVIIIGGGPAGLTAGIYAGRAKLDTLIIEKEGFGGQITRTDGIENFPSAIDGETGQSLTDKMKKQCEKFGVEFVVSQVTKIQPKDRIKTVSTAKQDYQSKTIIYAAGAVPNKLGCEGEEEFIGRGVSFCATCDGGFFTDLPVYVVGGGDSAVDEAIFLTKFAKSVTVIHRREELRANKTSVERAKNNPKISWLLGKQVEKIGGDGVLQSIHLKDSKTGEITKIDSGDSPMMGMFEFVGIKPQTRLIKDYVDTDENGYVLSKEDTITKTDGLFVAGDCRKKPLRQVITAASDGAVAANMAEQYIQEKFK